MVDKKISQISENEACLKEGKCESPQDRVASDAGLIVAVTMKRVEGGQVSADEWNNEIMPVIRVMAEGLPEDASANEVARAAFPELFAKADKLNKEEQAHAEQNKGWEAAQKLKAMSSGAEAGRKLVETTKGLWGTVTGMFNGGSAPATPPSAGRWGEVDTTDGLIPEYESPVIEQDDGVDDIIAQQTKEAKEVGEPVEDEVSNFIPYTDASGRKYQFAGVSFRTFSPEDNGFILNPITYVAYKDPHQKAVIFEVVRNDDGSRHLRDTGVRVSGEIAAIKASIQLSGRWDGIIEFPPFSDALSEENPFAELEMVP